MAKFDYKEIARSVAASEIGRKRVNTSIQKKFDQSKAQMMQEFDNHPVTQEISNGPGSTNISETLGGEGDLFSFIGFEAGDTPIQEVREVLDRGTVLISSKKGTATGANRVSYKFSVRIPTAEIEKASPIPWEAGKSWVKGIEKGISGFGHFIRGLFKKSRSGGGIQVEQDVRDKEFQTRPYLTELFKGLVERVKKK